MLIEIYEKGAFNDLNEASADKVANKKVKGVTIPCIGRIFSGNTPTPITKRPAINRNKIYSFLPINLARIDDEITTVVPNRIIEML
jgi:hypothetical protein